MKTDSLRDLAPSRFLCAAVLLLPSLPLHGATVFDDLGPGDSCDLLCYGIGEVPGGDGAYTGARFTPVQTCVLDTLQLALGLRSGPNRVDLTFARDAGSGTAFEVLETFHLEYAMPSDISLTSGSLVSLSSSRHPTLEPGQSYWIAASGHDMSGGWHYNSTQQPGPVVQGLGPIDLAGQWTGTQPAFRVEGTAIPEPSPALLLIAGLGIIGVLDLLSCRPSVSFQQRP